MRDTELTAEAVGNKFTIIDPTADCPLVDIDEIGDVCDCIKRLSNWRVAGVHRLKLLVEDMSVIRCCRASKLFAVIDSRAACRPNARARAINA